MSNLQPFRNNGGQFVEGNPYGFRNGQSGNPGGNYRNTPKLSNAYCKLLALNEDELNAYVPENAAEIIALRVIGEAIVGDVKQLVAAVKEIADRTEGKAVQTRVVEHNGDARMMRECLVFSLILLAKLDGRELTREGAIIELDAEAQKLALVEGEAKRLAEEYMQGEAR
jgi:hypothetical protein